jgi:pimeloyl-ACP methyl ester carboxylesterase
VARRLVLVQGGTAAEAGRARSDAPDLPSLGRDRTPVARFRSTVGQTASPQVVEAAVSPLSSWDTVAAGIVISAVAERVPKRIAMLVYLTAFLLLDGETLLEVAQAADSSLVVPNIVVADDQASMTVPGDAAQEAFYGECSPEDVVLASMLLAPEAIAPNSTPLRVTDSRFGSVPRVYIECLRDKAIPVALQRRMAHNSPCEIVASLDSDHSPFLSTPGPLVDHLLALRVSRRLARRQERS